MIFKNLLVTGGAGFIGSNLVDKLVSEGFNVRVLDDLSYGNRYWVNGNAEFIHGDIRDIDVCNTAVKGVDAVFHLAAMSRSGPSFQNVSDCTEINVLGTQNMLLAARDAGVSRFIYSGSSTYYGNSPSPQNELTSKADFLNAYGLSKFVGEEYVRLFDKIYNLPTVSFRYFNVYGPRQPVEGVYALVMGIFLQRKVNSLPLIVHGDGLQRRDFVHVTDVVGANLAALTAKSRGNVYNVGSGENHSILELANLISNDIVFESRRSGDADITLADISNIKNDLNWTPLISFEEGLRQMLDLYASNSSV